MYADEGVSTLIYRATDNAGDQERTRSQELMIDTRKPVITAAFDAPTFTRIMQVTVHYGATDPTPGSGLASVGGQLDGAPVNDGQILDVFWAPLGQHTLVVTAADVAGWVTAAAASFELIATLASLSGTIARLRQLGEIDNDGIERSFLAKVHAATSAAQRGQPNVAQNELSALLAELSAQRGHHISDRAAQFLIGDVTYVQAHLA